MAKDRVDPTGVGLPPPQAQPTQKKTVRMTFESEEAAQKYLKERAATQADAGKHKQVKITQATQEQLAKAQTAATAQSNNAVATEQAAKAGETKLAEITAGVHGVTEKIELPPATVNKLDKKVLKDIVNKMGGAAEMVANLRTREGGMLLQAALDELPDVNEWSMMLLLIELGAQNRRINSEISSGQNRVKSAANVMNRDAEVVSQASRAVQATFAQINLRMEVMSKFGPLNQLLEGDRIGARAGEAFADAAAQRNNAQQTKVMKAQERWKPSAALSPVEQPAADAARSNLEAALKSGNPTAIDAARNAYASLVGDRAAWKAQETLAPAGSALATQAQNALKAGDADYAANTARLAELRAEAARLERERMTRSGRDTGLTGSDNIGRARSGTSQRERLARMRSENLGQVSVLQARRERILAVQKDNDRLLRQKEAELHRQPSNAALQAEAERLKQMRDTIPTVLADIEQQITDARAKHEADNSGIEKEAADLTGKSGLYDQLDEAQRLGAMDSDQAVGDAFALNDAYAAYAAARDVRPPDPALVAQKREALEAARRMVEDHLARARVAEDLAKPAGSDARVAAEHYLRASADRSMAASRLRLAEGRVDVASTKTTAELASTQQELEEARLQVESAKRAQEALTPVVALAVRKPPLARAHMEQVHAKSEAMLKASDGVSTAQANLNSASRRVAELEARLAALPKDSPEQAALQAQLDAALAARGKAEDAKGRARVDYDNAVRDLGAAITRANAPLWKAPAGEADRYVAGQDAISLAGTAFHALPPLEGPDGVALMLGVPNGPPPTPRLLAERYAESLPPPPPTSERTGANAVAHAAASALRLDAERMEAAGAVDLAYWELPVALRPAAVGDPVTVTPIPAAAAEAVKHYHDAREVAAKHGVPPSADAAFRAMYGDPAGQPHVPGSSPLFPKTTPPVTAAQMDNPATISDPALRKQVLTYLYARASAQALAASRKYELTNERSRLIYDEQVPVAHAEVIVAARAREARLLAAIPPPSYRAGPPAEIPAKDANDARSKAVRDMLDARRDAMTAMAEGRAAAATPARDAAPILVAITERKEAEQAVAAAEAEVVAADARVADLEKQHAAAAKAQKDAIGAQLQAAKREKELALGRREVAHKRVSAADSSFAEACGAPNRPYTAGAEPKVGWDHWYNKVGYYTASVGFSVAGLGTQGVDAVLNVHVDRSRFLLDGLMNVRAQTFAQCDEFIDTLHGELSRATLRSGPDWQKKMQIMKQLIESFAKA